MNYKEVLQIIRDFEESKLQSLELEMNDIKIKMTKNQEPVYDHHSSKPVKEEMKPQEAFIPHGHVVKSPLVGTYYASASPSHDPFINVGDHVKRGDTLCIIEAMKIMNEITAPISGKVLAIHCQNGDTVGFEQVLVTIEDAK